MCVCLSFSIHLTSYRELYILVFLWSSCFSCRFLSLQTAGLLEQRGEEEQEEVEEEKGGVDVRREVGG